MSEMSATVRVAITWDQGQAIITEADDTSHGLIREVPVDLFEKHQAAAAAADAARTELLEAAGFSGDEDVLSEESRRRLQKVADIEEETERRGAQEQDELERRFHADPEAVDAARRAARSKSATEIDLSREQQLMEDVIQAVSRLTKHTIEVRKERDQLREQQEAWQKDAAELHRYRQQNAEEATKQRVHELLAEIKRLRAQLEEQDDE